MNPKALMLAAVLALAPAALAHAAAPLPAYGETALYDGVAKTSQLLPSYDGTRLAITIYRPTKNGQVTTDKLPVIVTQMRSESAQVKYFVERGYVWVGHDRRGTGASFGKQTGFVNPRDISDAKTVIEWSVAQPFSTGKAVTIGCSNQGVWQYGVAAKAPKGLVAIAPACASPQFYDDAVVINGVPMFETRAKAYNGECNTAPAGGPPRGGAPAGPAAGGPAAPGGPAAAPAAGAPRGAGAGPGGPPGGMPARGGGMPRTLPVDEDKDGSLLKAAAEEQKCNAVMLGQFALNQPRDALNTYDNYRPALEDSAITYAAEVKKSGIAVLSLGAWYDAAGPGQFGAHNLWGGRVIMGPWMHSNNAPAGSNFPDGKLNLDAETLRWFDYHAKGVKNGADKPSVLYYTVNAPAGQEWRTTTKWRWNGDKKVPYYFGADKLETKAPTALTPISYAGRDVGIFDGRYNSLNRWSATDFSATDAISLSQTTAPLSADMEMTGSPTARLWMSADTADANIFAVLTDVGPDGKSTFVTDGRLRASWRKTHPAAWGVKEQVWHRGYAEDIMPLKPGEAVELVFDLNPMSYVFKKGHSVRVSLSTSIGQKYHAAPLAGGKEPTIQLYRDKARPSAIELPTVRAK